MQYPTTNESQIRGNWHPSPSPLPPSLPTTQPTPFPPLCPSLPLPFNQTPPPFPGFFPSPFPSSVGFFPFHSFCPPHPSSLNTPPPSVSPLQPQVWPRSITTVSPTPLPNSLPPPPKLSPQGRGGSNGSFRIDSKTFSFSFDDQADSYAIHESRRNFKSSVCLGRKGLEWILSCFADIRDWVPGKDYLYKRYRENNKFFEFQGRSNKAGIFVEIAVYYGGARRGWIMVPASSNRSGWCLFSKELDSFLSGSNTVWVKGRTSDEDAGAGAGPGPTEGGGQFGKKSSKIRKQRKLRNFEISRAVSGHNVLKDATGFTVSSINGRPTRDFKFELTPANLALRVSKSVGGKRMVTWLNQFSTHKSINSGPVLLSGHDKAHSHKSIVSGPVLLSGHDKAHLADPSGKAQDVLSFHRGVGASLLHNQSARVVGESSKPPMKSSVLSVLPEGLSAGLSPISSPDHSSELLASNPSRELGAPVTENASALRSSSVAVLLDSGKAVSPMDTVSDAEESHGIGIRDSGFTSDPAVSSPTAALEAPILKGVSSILGQYPWVIQNRFSPLSELDCLKVVDEGVPERPANSGSRGLRELKGLISNVNYNGVSSRSKSRVSLTAAGVVGSCK
ncbi:hypothetical protein CMV_018193 [Castanea mollissima]|uniref:Uncharacterized protein n=1 Tax=Castanea mollissima TaxID=60419 RepID=A0A8J4VHY0_9ROSI|nr:hypothetical protein CMV_018193 [Castanea mollissima]